MEKKQKSITAKRLENIALFYLSKYESSSANMSRVLARRVLKAKAKGAEISPQTDEWIAAIVKKMLELGYIDDSRYTENMLTRLNALGKSRRFIENKLSAAGISPELRTKALNAIADNEETNAQIFVRKHHLGRDKNNMRKDLAKLARAGFSYDIARKVLNYEEDETWD